MPTVNVTDENFEKEVLQSKKTVLLDFWAPWCSPCRQISPILEQISDEMANQITVGKLNIDKEINSGVKYGIKSIPTMLIFKEGALKSQKIGATGKSDIISWIKENI